MTEYGNDLDYELDPFTVEALAMFRDGNDASRSEQYRNDLVRELLDKIDTLTIEHRGLIIIDLLTLNSVLGEAISVMQIKAIEEAQQ